MGRTGWAPLGQAHLWLGWAIAAWLLLMATTGTALVFKPELKALAAPPCAPGAARPLADALETIDRNSSGGVRLVIPASSEFCLHEVIFRDAVGGAYVDPSSLRTVQVWGPNGRLTNVLLELHRHLLLQQGGKLPTAVFAAGTLVLTFAGLALALRRPGALSLRLWPLAKTPGALLASHRNLGVLLAAPLVFMAASGWAMTYPKQAQTLIAQALGERPQSPARSARAEAGSPRWPAALATAEAAFPGLAPRVVTWPAKPGAPIVFRFRQPGEWAANGQSTATVAPVSARLLARVDARRGSRALQFWGALYPLHAGHVPPRIAPLLIVFTGMGAALMLIIAIAANSLRRIRRS